MQNKIAITLGEPAGIGAELIDQLLKVDSLEDCVIVGDKELLSTIPSNLVVEHLATNEKVQLGKLNVNNSQYVLNLLNRATQGCMNGEYSAMLTCPLHKGIINHGGLKFTGHTEYLAKLSHTKKVVMMLLNKHMRVALVTTHMPLKEVAQNITKENIQLVLDVLITDMQSKFAIKNPHIALCGLNPHAGEDGHLGMEEIEIINPLIKSYQEKGYNIYGAIPADTLFTVDKLKNYDAILAMYHDQGLTPLKYAGFGKSVNITLGLPFIRTSVDHGTALDIAGKNQANPDSLYEALKLTRQLVANAK